nr:MAG TPA: hypothetical protein [Caudoviricetes sp.]
MAVTRWISYELYFVFSDLWTFHFSVFLLKMNSKSKKWTFEE